MQQTVRDRILQRVTVDDPSGCWLWAGPVTHDGYPQMSGSGRSTTYVHRVMYELCVGPIPDGMQIDHVYERGCRHRHCINPDHLEPVTGLENVRRGKRHNANKTHCKRGHALTPDNVRMTSHGSRACLTCDAEVHRPRRYAKRKGG